MGVSVFAPCVGCGRYSSFSHEDDDKYECNRCERNRMNKNLKRSTQQVWWIRFLKWMMK